MERLRGLAQEALSWTFLEAEQCLMWAAVLGFDAVPVQETGNVVRGCRACRMLHDRQAPACRIGSGAM